MASGMVPWAPRADPMREPTEKMLAEQERRVKAIEAVVEWIGQQVTNWRVEAEQTRKPDLEALHQDENRPGLDARPAGLAMTAFEADRRAALYLRVSTRGQTTQNQERELRRWAERLGFELVRLYVETARGARGDRNGRSALLAQHAQDMLKLIWARVGRTGERR